MNIDLIYQGNKYNFDLRKDINLKYIHNLASKLIDKDISTFDLIYKNEILSDYQYSTLLKDLSNDNNNISIIISPKDNNNMLSNVKIKIFTKIKNLKISKNPDNINNQNIMPKSDFIISQNNSRENSKKKLYLAKNKKAEITKEYISENKVFEDIYNSKENEIISLMNDLSQKIKKYYGILYGNYKNKKERSNNELSLYEKNIFEFKNKQIIFLKKLLNFFNNDEKNFISGELSLKDFFIVLDQSINLKSFDLSNIFFNKKKVNNNNNNINNKKNNKNNNNININKNNFNDKPKIKLTENNQSRVNIDDKKLPLLIDNKLRKGSKIYLTESNNTIYSDDINENNSEFEDEQKFLKKKEKKYLGNKNENKNYKIILNKTYNSKDKIITNKKDNNINLNIESNNKKNILNKEINFSITNGKSKDSNHTLIQGKNSYSNNIKNEKMESNKNNLLIKSKTKQENGELNEFIKNKEQKKIKILFEEPKNSPENKDQINFESSELSSSSERRFSRASNRKLSRMSRIGDDNIYKRNLSKRATKKYRKIGNNIYDFII